MDHENWIRAKDVAEILGVRRHYIPRIVAEARIRTRKLPASSRKYYKPDVLDLLRRSVENGPAPEFETDPALARAQAKASAR